MIAGPIDVCAPAFRVSAVMEDSVELCTYHSLDDENEPLRLVLGETLVVSDSIGFKVTRLARMDGEPGYVGFDVDCGIGDVMVIEGEVVYLKVRYSAQISSCMVASRMPTKGGQ